MTIWHRQIAWRMRIAYWMPKATNTPSEFVNSYCHLHRLIIPDDVLIQFDLLMMSAATLETCGDMK